MPGYPVLHVLPLHVHVLGEPTFLGNPDEGSGCLSP